MVFWLIYTAWGEVALISLITPFWIVFTLWWGLDALKIVRVQENLLYRTLSETVGSGRTLRIRNKVETNISVKLMLKKKEIRKTLRKEMSHQKRNMILCQRALYQIQELRDTTFKVISSVEQKKKQVQPEVVPKLKAKLKTLYEITDRIESLAQKCEDLLKELKEQRLLQN